MEPGNREHTLQSTPKVVGGEPDYSEAEVKAVLRRRQFEYHRVETRDLILPKSLAGKSVLDVGSALGYFCFVREDGDAYDVEIVDYH